jgi:predicted transcriptional regulator
MHALSIRQPYAEMILRGIKTAEYRSRPTTRINQRFYLYAAKQPGATNGFVELGCAVGELPTGVIVGTARIARCQRQKDGYAWHLTEVRRLARPRRIKRQPQPAWFRPF